MSGSFQKEIDIDLYHQRMKRIRSLETELINLGETRNFIKSLKTSFSDKYLLNPNSKNTNDKYVTDLDKYDTFSKNYISYLLEIAKAKYPFNYNLLKKEYEK